MTKKDLRLIYKQETGKYSPTVKGDKLGPISNEKEYIEWLEEKLINLYNL